ILEGRGIKQPLSLVSIAPQAPVITPWHKFSQRVLEDSRGDGRHGSVGIGFGEAVADRLHNGLCLTIEEIANYEVDHLTWRLSTVQSLALTKVKGLYNNELLQPTINQILDTDPRTVAGLLQAVIKEVEIRQWTDINQEHESVIL